jgi:hypothetical protein
MIPTQIEKDFLSGKARYRTFQTGNGGQSILTVSPNEYIVIFAYDFSPAGGGFVFKNTPPASTSVGPDLYNTEFLWFETQQISFYTGDNFYPFIHHVDAIVSGEDSQLSFNYLTQINNSPIYRNVFIVANKDVTITHGLIQTAFRNTATTIPVTSRTPQALTYGGSGQSIQLQTDYGPVLNPQQFMQPSPKDFLDFGAGLLPNNATNQAFATPDATNGLLAANVVLSGFGDEFVNSAATNYYLCCHYAVYTTTTPEQL